MNNINLRPMKDEDKDYKLLLEWFKDNEVVEFYSTHPITLEAVKEKYRPRVINAYTGKMVPIIVMVDNIEAGYIQYYPVEYKEYGLGEFEKILSNEYSNPYAIDIFLGGTKFLNRGIGTESLKLLAEDIFKGTNCDVILIDPNALNHRAIRCYEKVGFKVNGIMKNRDLYKGQYTDSVLMSLSKKEYMNV